jgi:metallo-beta-lactamase family protein
VHAVELEFIGAAREVTGSMHLLHAAGSHILLDCGLFQGRRRESVQRNRERPMSPGLIDAVVLSHAHIDHSGALPLLVKRGYRGPIYATPATRDLCAVMLADAAMIQEHDARYVNRLVERGVPGVEPIEALYEQRDVAQVLSQMVTIPYRRRQRLVSGIDFTFLDAGHVLGSSIVCLDVDEDGAERRLVFTGDLGRSGAPILRDPEVPSGASVLLTESTYGDRLHPAAAAMDDALREVICRTHARGGKVIIPAFALERAQEIIYALKRMRVAGALPQLRVFVDSPLAVRVTEIFRLHPECFDAETAALFRGADNPFEFAGLHYVQTVEESMAIDTSDEPCVVISASGMCEFGRVLHHLKASIGSENNSVVIVGFQAQHTLGRRLVEGRKRVSIFGVERDRRAEVVVLNGFSAHADRDDLVRFAEAARKRGPLRKVLLVHGEPKAQAGLQEALAARGFPDVSAPASGERIRL